MRALRLAKIASIGALGVAVALTGVIGLAHTRAGRPLLVAIAPLMRAMGGGKGLCPLGYDAAATPEQRDAARAAFARTHRGEARAQGRPALGFQLDVTTREDVMAWAKSHGAVCGPRAGGIAAADLECRGVPDALLPEGARGATVSSLWLTFGARGGLDAVVAVRSAAAAEPISRTFAAVTQEVTEGAGPPTTTAGHGTASELAPLLAESTAEYRFADYYAIARAANVGSSFVLTEEYRSLAN